MHKNSHASFPPLSFLLFLLCSLSFSFSFSSLTSFSVFLKNSQLYLLPEIISSSSFLNPPKMLATKMLLFNVTETKTKKIATNLADGKKPPSGPKSKLQKVIPFARHNKLGPNSSVGYFGIQRSEEILPENMAPFGSFGAFSTQAILSGQFPRDPNENTPPPPPQKQQQQQSTSSSSGAKSKRYRAGTDSEDENLPPHGRGGGGSGARQRSRSQSRHQQHQQQHQRSDSLSSPLSDLSGTILSSSNQVESSGSASGSKTVTDSDSEM